MAQQAEQLFEKMQAQQLALRQIFTRLVKPGEGTADTRQRALLSDLKESAHLLIRKLADKQLLVTSRDEEEEHADEDILLRGAPLAEAE